MSDDKNALLQAFRDAGHAFYRIEERGGPSWLILNHTQYMDLGGTEEGWEILGDVEFEPGVPSGLKWVSRER